MLKKNISLELVYYQKIIIYIFVNCGTHILSNNL